MTFALIIPLANEANNLDALVSRLSIQLNNNVIDAVYFVVDNASKDDTYKLCKKYSNADSRFISVWGEENKNAIDAYMLGYKTAFEDGNDYFIEMDGGLSHDPAALSSFKRALLGGNECAFGSRFINGGSIQNSRYSRLFLSKFGTFVSNIILGMHFKDGTSGFIGMNREILSLIIKQGIKSKSHFYQTELRFLLRKRKYIEIPIHYSSPSNSVSTGSIKDSIKLLFRMLLLRFRNFEL